MRAIVGSPVASVEQLLCCGDSGDKKLQTDGLLAVRALDEERNEDEGGYGRNEKRRGQNEEEEVERFTFDKLGQDQTDYRQRRQHGRYPHRSSDSLPNMFPSRHFNLMPKQLN
jgi:hypothetical protein